MLSTIVAFTQWISFILMKRIDPRIKLLEKICDLNKGSSEFIANKFLSTLDSDLGSIRRLLIELIDNDYILESNNSKGDHKNSIVRNIETITSDEQLRLSKKSSRRLVHQVGPFEKIPSIRLIITLKGINFLIENKKLKNELILSYWQKFWFWPIAVVAVLGLIMSIISLFMNKVTN